MAFDQQLRSVVLTLVPMILSLTVHECAHAWSAYRLGDTTAKDAGRLTLNPLVHIDLLGTIIFPTLSALGGGIGFLGWARPTPFRPDRMRKGLNRRVGSAIVSAAGPLSNLVLALLSAAAISILAHAGVPLHNAAGVATPLAMLLSAMFLMNVGLTVFNLLPFPPLDGHALLPPFFDPIMVPLQRFGMLILFVVMMWPQARAVVAIPIEWLQEKILMLFGLVG